MMDSDKDIGECGTCRFHLFTHNLYFSYFTILNYIFTSSPQQLLVPSIKLFSLLAQSKPYLDALRIWAISTIGPRLQFSEASQGSSVSPAFCSIEAHDVPRLFSARLGTCPGKTYMFDWWFNPPERYWSAGISIKKNQG